VDDAVDAIRVEGRIPQNRFEDRSDVENHASRLSLVATHETNMISLAGLVRADISATYLNRALIAALTLPERTDSERRVLELAS